MDRQGIPLGQFNRLALDLDACPGPSSGWALVVCFIWLVPRGGTLLLRGFCLSEILEARVPHSDPQQVSA